MRYTAAIVIVAIVALLGVSRAHAGILTLDLDLDDFEGLISEPAMGTARIVLAGVDEQGRLMGDSAPASLQIFEAQGTLPSDLGMALGSATLGFRLVSPGSGAFDGESASFTLPDTALPCFGPATCATPTGPSSSAVLGFVLADLGIPGNARAFVFLASPGLVAFQANGREIARRFQSVPEPVAATLLVLGFAALAIHAMQRRLAP